MINLKYEFDLKFDDIQDDDTDRKKNSLKRQQSINSLIEFLNEQKFQKKDLSHIQSIHFKLKWNGPLGSELFPSSGNKSFGFFFKNILIKLYLLACSKKVLFSIPLLAFAYFYSFRDNEYLKKYFE